MKILVTGANGFVGRALVHHLQRTGCIVSTAVRGAAQASVPGRNLVASIDGATDWRTALAGQAAVVHCAARVHVLREKAGNPLQAFREVNVQGTLNLAEQAADAGVQRFVFVSSIGVNGAQTTSTPFRETDPLHPHTPYAVSKAEAEAVLFEIGRRTGMEIVVVRPPLVYGPSAPGNFEVMVRWVARGLPFPLASVDNLRSYVSRDNLVDLLGLCLLHPAAADEVFLVCDGHDLSTPDLLRKLGVLLHRPARLLPVPPSWLVGGARLLGRPEVGIRLCASLQIDLSKARDLLGWRPPVSVDEGLSRAVTVKMNAS